MTAFQIVALLTPAMIGFALLVMAVILRRQNRSRNKLNATVSTASRRASDVKANFSTAPDDVEFALAAIHEAMNTSPQSRSNISGQIHALSDDIHRKLDIMTELVKSRESAR